MSAASRQAAQPSSDPSARKQSDPSGRLLLRMPRTLHGALAEAAEREGTSLNQFITGTLSSAIGWSADGKAQPAPRAAATQSPPSRTLVTVLVVNAVAVGLAALGAVGILLLAWLG